MLFCHFSFHHFCFVGGGEMASSISVDQQSSEFQLTRRARNHAAAVRGLIGVPGNPVLFNTKSISKPKKPWLNHYTFLGIYGRNHIISDLLTWCRNSSTHSIPRPRLHLRPLGTRAGLCSCSPEAKTDHWKCRPPHMPEMMVLEMSHTRKAETHKKRPTSIVIPHKPELKSGNPNKT